jgi:Zn-dependent M28 family amino/carboxypeptidase
VGVIVIPYDTAIKNTRQYLLSKAFNLTRDTTTAFVLVAPEYKENFKELKGYFGKRFTSGRKTNKIFVLGVTSVLNYSIKATQKIEPITMSNVVGIIPGKTKPDEFVVFSGHYDHIGINPVVDGDSISNGADDDASGTTAVIELARYFKKIKNNNRTIIFVAFTAEEIGGYGSRYFSEQLNPDKVVAMFNIEMIGKPSKWGQNSAFITGYERSDFGEILQKNLKSTQFQFHPDPYPQQNLFYRSDNATLARLGVPAHTISTDEIDIDKFYHTVNDEVETLNMANITSTIRAIALSSQSIVAGTDTPKRIDKSTVR